ncbi:hypothetical protein PRIPAC_72727 [Pristionchus pacificus]|uniref:Ankyrin repeat-containing protein n=1 Tax=Pristionchus pacificus TaxID=54126 RepID=A0A2A6CR17_PRIPA|nr:hypothetical protein PRIPAC_72727 [Pristionchus pacificus]|eukprot:PDM80664.1 Ankyrin repeat-containing protein [Pristionchus pacificus]
MALLLFLLFPIVSTRPVFIEQNGTTFSLNAGLCESYSCGLDESRGICVNHIFAGRPAHYCKCNLPFTGAFCHSTLRLNASLPGSRYSECPFPLYCASVYGNGECNQECNTVECLYDGYECQMQPKCPQEEYCRDRFSNSVCDEVCMREECEFDGGDCFSEMDTLPGQLLIRLSLTAENFMRLSHLFLFQLSRFLRATVVLSQDARGPLLWRWSPSEGRGPRILKGENSSTGIEVAFSVDLSRCSVECLDTIERVVGFIDQSLAAKSSPISSAIIQSVSSSSLPPSSPPLTLHTWAALGGLFVMATVVFGVVVSLRQSRKRVLDTPVWFPPSLGEDPVVLQPTKKPRLAPVRSLLHQQAEGIDPIDTTEDSDIDERDGQGRTALLLAIRSERKEQPLREAVSELIKRGADVTVVDENGWGALHHAFHKLRSPNFNRWLISLGANPQVVDGAGRSLIHLSTEYNDLLNLQMILETAAIRLIDLPDHSNRIAISIAVADFTLPITRCLIDNGADVNSNGAEQFDQSVPRRYPLHIAVQCNNKDHVRMLIQEGARMQVRDNRERTALHYAVIYADLAMCRLIVDAGTQVDAEDDEGRTAEEMAAEWHMIEIEQFLISVRGRNEPYRKRKRAPKRYSSDQGYGSEESHRQEKDGERDSSPTGRSDTVATTPPLPPLVLSPRDSFGIPKWGTMAQLPIFHTRPLMPLTMMHTPLQTGYPAVLTPSHALLGGSFTSLAPPSPFPTNFQTPM